MCVEIFNDLRKQTNETQLNSSLRFVRPKCTPRTMHSVLSIRLFYGKFRTAHFPTEISDENRTNSTINIVFDVFFLQRFFRLKVFEMLERD